MRSTASVQPENAWSLVARPATHTEQTAAVYQGHQVITPQPLRQDILSTELLDMVVEQLLPDKKDVIAFGFTSKLHWQVVRRHIQSQYLKSCAPLADTNIALQGSYSTDLLSAFTENGLAESITGRACFGDMCAARRFYSAHKGLETPISAHHLEKGYSQAMRVLTEDCGGSKARWEVMKEDLAGRQHFSQDRKRVLRNLTTRELVSIKQTASTKLKTRCNSASTIPGLNIDDILLMKICWTGISSAGPDTELGINCGLWAGHRFDIVTLDDHQAEEETKWSDVTTYVTKEAKALEGKIKSWKKESEDWDEDW